MSASTEEPADLLGLTQSKLEGCLRTRKASNLRRLVLLANAAFTSEAAAQDAPEYQDGEAEDLEEDDFRKLQEQEWFEQVMEEFLAEDQDGDMDFLDFIVLEELASAKDLLGEPSTALMESEYSSPANHWQLHMPTPPRFHFGHDSQDACSCQSHSPFQVSSSVTSPTLLAYSAAGPLNPSTQPSTSYSAPSLSALGTPSYTPKVSTRPSEPLSVLSVNSRLSEALHSSPRCSRSEQNDSRLVDGLLLSA